jgi:hypothetical protein
MGNKTTTDEQVINVPVTTVVGYNVDYVPYYGTIVPLKRPLASIVNVPVRVKEETTAKNIKPTVSKMKYSDNDVEVKASWNGSDLKISKKCK